MEHHQKSGIESAQQFISGWMGIANVIKDDARSNVPVLTLNSRSCRSPAIKKVRLNSRKQPHVMVMSQNNGLKL